jgi:hypothetical protein
LERSNVRRLSKNTSHGKMPCGHEQDCVQGEYHKKSNASLLQYVGAAPKSSRTLSGDTSALMLFGTTALWMRKTPMGWLCCSLIMWPSRVGLLTEAGSSPPPSRFSTCSANSRTVTLLSRTPCSTPRLSSCARRRSSITSSHPCCVFVVVLCCVVSCTCWWRDLPLIPPHPYSPSQGPQCRPRSGCAE